MDIPPYISVSILNNPSFTCTATKEEPNSDSRREPPKSEGTSITIHPKKRSFDVAFLISTDEERPRKSPITEPQHSPNETIRSAFRKVGLGFSKFPDSRSPSPIDPIRTPSPQETHRQPKGSRGTLPPRETIFHPFSGVFTPRFTREKEAEKNLGFVGGGFLNPVGVSRSSFLPAPIFGGAPILPSGFVTASLLPPSLAALTLPAQNVCAKCNVSFRMTSDLVYHMRSHHKNDHTSPEQLRRRRELDKLKCPVCNESFRERHHLTRHMTAHQDKAGDNLERPESNRGGCSLKFCASPSEYQQ